MQSASLHVVVPSSAGHGMVALVTAIWCCTHARVASEDCPPGQVASGLSFLPCIPVPTPHAVRHGTPVPTPRATPQHVGPSPVLPEHATRVPTPGATMKPHLEDASYAMGERHYEPLVAKPTAAPANPNAGSSPAPTPPPVVAVPCAGFSGLMCINGNAVPAVLHQPTLAPSQAPTNGPTTSPTSPTAAPTLDPTYHPTPAETMAPHFETKVRLSGNAIIKLEHHFEEHGSMTKTESPTEASRPSRYHSSPLRVRAASDPSFLICRLPLSNCPEGKFRAKDGAACSQCQYGTYSPQVGSWSCKKCPAGKWAGGAGCLTCKAGKFSAAGNPMCTSCPKGKYMDRPKASYCATCNLGQFQTLAAQVSCTWCAAGQYSRIRGAGIQYDCALCPIGKYASADSDKCHSCAPGRFGDNPDQPSESAGCLDCPVGKYQELAGLSACVRCARGKFGKMQTGALSETDYCLHCPKGKWQQDDESTKCDTCPRGRYSNFVPERHTTSKKGYQTHCDCCPMTNDGGNANGNCRPADGLRAYWTQDQAGWHMCVPKPLDCKKRPWGRYSSCTKTCRSTAKPKTVDTSWGGYVKNDDGSPMLRIRTAQPVYAAWGGGVKCADTDIDYVSKHNDTIWNAETKEWVQTSHCELPPCGKTACQLLASITLLTSILGFVCSCKGNRLRSGEVAPLVSVYEIVWWWTSQRVSRYCDARSPWREGMPCCEQIQAVQRSRVW